MDLTQFPESIQLPLTELLTSLETIYRVHPECIVVFLRRVVKIFGATDFREASSQTENDNEDIVCLKGVDEPKEASSDERETSDYREVVKEQVWDLKNLAEDVRSVAEQTLNQSSFVYDNQSGTYYNYGQQCYYIPEHKLYYYVQNKAYYTYDEENNCMKLYSPEAQHQINLSETKKTSDLPSEEELAEPNNEVNMKCSESPLLSPKLIQAKIDDELEEGEIVSDEDDIEALQPVCSPTPLVITASPKKLDLNVEPKDHCAPCIRITVRECDSDKLELGRLFIITRSGGTLGREGQHDIIIPDLNVSKEHLTFHYKYKDGLDVYEIVDSCSKNGTLVNGLALEQNKPHKLEHGSVLKVGGTLLLCHIHDGLGTCDECEPSCLGFLSTNGPVQQNHSLGPSLKSRHAQEIVQIKRKFGLSQNRQAPKLPKGYVDKSKIRRETVGSSHDCEKTETNSVDAPIRKDNKGYEMLAKMGWKEGEGVGKSGEGNKAPINVSVKLSKRGLGCEEECPPPQVHSKNKEKLLEITKKRYDETRE